MTKSTRYVTATALCILLTGFAWAADTQTRPQAKAPSPPTESSISLPAGTGGIGFDDLLFSSALDKVIVPAGRTGRLDLVVPTTGAVTSISGFSTHPAGTHHRGEGITSVDEGSAYLFVTDRTARTVDVINLKDNRIAATAKLAGGPDYVRYVAPTHEIWVTEPHQERIEVFSLPAKGKPTPHHEAFIPVPGGPEDIVVDAARGRVYTNLWKTETLAIDLHTHKILARWSNGCKGSRGLVLDAKDGWLFVGCAEGGASVLDVARGGKELDHTRAGRGVDIIAYSPELRHLYVPGARSATLSIFGVAKTGKLVLLGTAPTARGAHGVAAGAGRAFVPVPSTGALLVVKDPYKPFAR
jgi:DNA-binding beta-propeller fold protein YncE